MTEINNHINFTARMDVKGFHKNTKRLKNIAKIFEEKTQKYPNDTFSLTNRGSDIHVYHLNDGISGLENEYQMTKKNWNNLLQKSDDYIANKLVKLFHINIRDNKETAIADRYINNALKRDKFEDATNFESHFWNAFLNKQRQDNWLARNNDSVLKNFIASTDATNLQV